MIREHERKSGRNAIDNTHTHTHTKHTGDNVRWKSLTNVCRQIRKTKQHTHTHTHTHAHTKHTGDNVRSKSLTNACRQIRKTKQQTHPQTRAKLTLFGNDKQIGINNNQASTRAGNRTSTLGVGLWVANAFWAYTEAQVHTMRCRRLRLSSNVAFSSSNRFFNLSHCCTRRKKLSSCVHTKQRMRDEYGNTSGRADAIGLP